MLGLNLFIKVLKLDRFKCRELSAGEIKLCQGVFADKIDYSTVKIMNHPYLPWQSKYVIMAPQGFIHARSFNYKQDYSIESIAYQALFIHEMTHVMQHQHHVNVLLKGAILQATYYLSLKRYNPYLYELKSNKKFNEYNIEQQGDIARDIFLKKIPNIIV